ncbi:hypothetical protein JCM10207_003882 [Rhodosporidiobolus poonsookiae]
MVETEVPPQPLRLRWTDWTRTPCPFSFAGSPNLLNLQQWVIAPAYIFHLLDTILDGFHQRGMRAFAGPAVELLFFFFLHNTHPSTLPPEQQGIWYSLCFGDVAPYFEARCADEPQLATRARSVLTLSTAQAFANFLVRQDQEEITDEQGRALHRKRLGQVCKLFVWLLGLCGVSAPKELKPSKSSTYPVVLKVGRQNNSARAALHQHVRRAVLGHSLAHNPFEPASRRTFGEGF